MTEDPLAAAVNAANRAADESQRARAESKATRESVDAQRVERARSTKWARIAVGVAFVMILGLLVVVIGGVRQASAQERAREVSRAQFQEVLSTLLSYSDPTSEIGKEQAARTTEFVQDLVRKGALATLEIQACRYEPDVGSFRACAAPFIPPAPAPAS